MTTYETVTPGDDENELKDAKHVVWALSEFFFWFSSYFWILTDVFFASLGFKDYI